MKEVARGGVSGRMDGRLFSRDTLLAEKLPRKILTQGLRKILNSIETAQRFRSQRIG